MGKAVKGVSRAIFGSSSQGKSGILGTGQFRGSKQDIDREPFKRKVAGTGQQEELAKKQRAQIERQEARATGKAPSLAEEQLKAASNRTLAQQLAAAQTGRGGSAAARERQLAKSQARSRREVSEQSAQARLQEQAIAEQTLAQQLAQQRGQEIELAAGDRASAQALQNLLVQENLGVQGLNLSGFQSAAQQRSGLITNVGSGLAGVFSRSDENSKTKIKRESSKSEGGSKDKKSFSKFMEGFSKNKTKESASDSTGKSTAQSAISKISAMSDERSKNVTKDKDFNPKSFLDAIKPYSYEYKDSSAPGAGEGRFLSPMAQDIEKAGPVGQSMVMDTPQGKMVDYGKGFGAILAAQAHLNERLSELEKKKK